jgi:hypothetical protein
MESGFCLFHGLVVVVVFTMVSLSTENHYHHSHDVCIVVCSVFYENPQVNVSRHSTVSHCHVVPPRRTKSFVYWLAPSSAAMTVNLLLAIEGELQLYSLNDNDCKTPLLFFFPPISLVLPPIGQTWFDSCYESTTAQSIPRRFSRYFITK